MKPEEMRDIFYVTSSDMIEHSARIQELEEKKMSNHPLSNKLTQAAQDSLKEAAAIQEQQKEMGALWKLISHLKTYQLRMVYKMIEAELSARPSDNTDDCG